MGYVVFELLNEDGEYVVYRYSHDSDVLDGTIKVKKGLCDMSKAGEWFERNVEITLSSTDSGNLFAMRIVSFLMKICNKNGEFPQKHMLAYG